MSSVIARSIPLNHVAEISAGFEVHNALPPGLEANPNGTVLCGAQFQWPAKHLLPDYSILHQLC